MREDHKAGYRQWALATLEWLKVEVGQDFHTLSSFQVEQLLMEADRTRYRKPKNANGSRARYFYAQIQRHAQLKV